MFAAKNGVVKTPFGSRRLLFRIDSLRSVREDGRYARRQTTAAESPPFRVRRLALAEMDSLDFGAVGLPRLCDVAADFYLCHNDGCDSRIEPYFSPRAWKSTASSTCFGRTFIGGSRTPRIGAKGSLLGIWGRTVSLWNATRSASRRTAEVTASH